MSHFGRLSRRLESWLGMRCVCGLTTNFFPENPACLRVYHQTQLKQGLEKCYH